MRSLGEISPEDDAVFHELKRLASEVRIVKRHLRSMTWERHSEEADVRYPMMGLLGDIDLEGPLDPFLRPLQAIELLHLGKATSHGLGEIRLLRSL